MLVLAVVQTLPCACAVGASFFWRSGGINRLNLAEIDLKKGEIGKLWIVDSGESLLALLLAETTHDMPGLPLALITAESLGTNHQAPPPKRACRQAEKISNGRGGSISEPEARSRTGPPLTRKEPCPRQHRPAGQRRRPAVRRGSGVWVGSGCQVQTAGISSAVRARASIRRPSFSWASSRTLRPPKGAGPWCGRNRPWWHPCRWRSPPSE